MRCATRMEHETEIYFCRKKFHSVANTCFRKGGKLDTQLQEINWGYLTHQSSNFFLNSCVNGHVPSKKLSTTGPKLLLFPMQACLHEVAKERQFHMLVPRLGALDLIVLFNETNEFRYKRRLVNGRHFKYNLQQKRSAAFQPITKMCQTLKLQKLKSERLHLSYWKLVTHEIKSHVNIWSLQHFICTGR